MWYDDSEEWVDPSTNLVTYRTRNEEAQYQSQTRIGLLNYLRPGYDWSFAQLFGNPNRGPPTKPRMQIAQPKFQMQWGLEKEDYARMQFSDYAISRRAALRGSKWVQHPRSSCNIKTRDTIWMNLRRWLRRARKAIYNRSLVGYLTTRGNGSISSMYNRALR